MAVEGMRMVLWGLFLKVVLADRLGLYVDSIYSGVSTHSGNSLKLGAVFYTLQIYCDFAGYSYIAVGCARLLGIKLITNFRRPYLAWNLNEFWKRWNISLTKWLTSNIYISLGGNRKGKVRSYINVVATFLVSGIWHGANLTFIFWGLLHGIVMAIEKFFGINKKEFRGLSRVFFTILTFGIVTVAWIYFRAPSISFANMYIAKMISTGGYPYIDTNTFFHIGAGLSIVITIEVMMEYYRSTFTRIFGCRPIRWGGYVMMTLLIILMGVFDSSQFIYIQF